jgi:hypothetical protein
MLLMRIVVVLATHAAFATATAATAPAFSWDTVPVFQQLCSVTGTIGAELLPVKKLRWLVRYFPLVTIEHCQGQGAEAYSGQVLQHGFIEDHYLALAAEIKALNSSTTVLYYNNVDAALPYFRMARPLYEDHPDWALKGAVSSGGHMFPNVSGLKFNQSVPAVRALWAEHYANMTRTGSPLDGIFIDVAGSSNKRANTTALFGSMQRQNPETIVGHVTSLATSAPYRLKQTYTFAATHGEISALAECSAQKGAICEAHYQPSFGSFGGEPHKNPSGWNATLAAFLIGAGEGSYLAFSTKTPQTGEYFCEGPYPTWASGMGWSDDYTRPLGPPDGPATRRSTADGGLVYSRSFGANATRVSLQLARGGEGVIRCEISWADGHLTRCSAAAAPPPPGPPSPGPAPASDRCTFEQETDYADASSRQIRVSGTGHAPRAACCDACTKDPSCAVAVVDKRNHTADGIACMLKGTATMKLSARIDRVACVPRR